MKKIDMQKTVLSTMFQFSCTNRQMNGTVAYSIKPSLVSRILISLERKISSTLCASFFYIEQASILTKLNYQ